MAVHHELSVGTHALLPCLVGERVRVRAQPWAWMGGLQGCPCVAVVRLVRDPSKRAGLTQSAAVYCCCCCFMLLPPRPRHQAARAHIDIHLHTQSHTSILALFERHLPSFTSRSSLVELSTSWHQSPVGHRCRAVPGGGKQAAAAAATAVEAGFC